MDWTPLVSTTMFDGIKTDMLTATGGIMMLVLIVVGGGILLRVIMR
jgi:hypothetical protein